ncbi:MAG TPA: hypothetical protein PKV21_03090 [bacterium]|nr:hypothetical protein [bacterium]HOM26475.1 hypothetical protein [bacterium]
MERKIRKVIERIKEIVLTLIFLFPLFTYSQNIDIYEEIEGKDLTEKKTKIFYIMPSITDINFPQIPEVKIEEETKVETEITETKEIIEEKKIEAEKGKKKWFFNGKSGNFVTRGFDIVYNDEKMNFGISNFYTENYRKNSGFFYTRFYLSSSPNLFNLDFITGQMELPGPVKNPFEDKREFFYLNWDFKKRFSYFNFGFSHKFYAIDEEISHFLGFNMEKDFKSFKLNTEIEEDIFDNESVFSITEYIIFEKENFLIKPGLKFIEGSGLRFLPSFLFKINENFSVFLSSDFEIPDLWKDVIMENWKEIKKEKVLPEEIYKGGVKFQFKDTEFEISHSYNKKYLWEDIANNNLYQPFREKFEKTGFLLNSKIPLKDNLNLFLEIEKDIFDKKISFLPEYKHNAGIEFKNEKINFKIWNSFTGERHFIKEDLKSFSTLNFEITYRTKFEIGFGIYNILNEEYEIAPDYPGEGRKFLIYFKF